MPRYYKATFVSFLIFISMINPGCKHATNNGLEIYRRYAVKNIIIVDKTVLKNSK